VTECRHDALRNVQCGPCGASVPSLIGMMHRRAQKAEAEVAKLKRLLANARPDPWKSEGRKREAIERDRQAEAIERANLAPDTQSNHVTQPAEK
jgi:hypothetical protein